VIFLGIQEFGDYNSDELPAISPGFAAAAAFLAILFSLIRANALSLEMTVRAVE
jgi:hypothetical protein